MPDPRDHRCEAPGCEAIGSHGFRERVPGGGFREHWFCPAHKDLGEPYVRPERDTGEAR